MIKDFFKNEKVNYVTTLLATVVIYGTIVNIPMKFIFDQPFTIMTCMGYGIISYFVKYEFPKLWSQLFPKK